MICIGSFLEQIDDCPRISLLHLGRLSWSVLHPLSSSFPPSGLLNGKMERQDQEAFKRMSKRKSRVLLLKLISGRQVHV